MIFKKEKQQTNSHVILFEKRFSFNEKSREIIRHNNYSNKEENVKKKRKTEDP